MDQIKIKGLEVFAEHGVFPEENTLGQKFIVNVTLYTDLRQAGFTDELGYSLDYGMVCKFITDFMKKHTFKLLESVAENLAARMLMELDGLEKVKVEIEKPWAPIGLPIQTVSVEIERSWHEVYLSFGSNMGERGAHIQNALTALQRIPGCKITAVSDIVETAPYGGVPQDNFLNGCLKLKTLMGKQELLDLLHGIEQQEGRERLLHWGPRTLDLDILFYDKEVYEDANLVIPHKDLHNREFVLLPMAQIAPNFRHPIFQKTMEELLIALEK